MILEVGDKEGENVGVDVGVDVNVCVDDEDAVGVKEGVVV